MAGAYFYMICIKITQSHNNRLQVIQPVLPAVMVQTNFVENVYRIDERFIQQDVMLNSDITADMAASPDFASNHLGIAEIKIGAGYSVKLESEQKNFYKDGLKCEPHTDPEGVISVIGQARGSFTTTRIGVTVSENYGLHMSPDRSFQFYKRES